MDIMHIAKPDKKQLNELLELWMDTFGDSEGFIRRFISSSFYRGCNVALCHGKIVSAVHLTAPTDDDRFIYGYAVATHEEYRGKGLCRMIHESIFADMREKYAVYGVHPASEGLVFFYKKLGMKISSYRYFSDVEGDMGKYVSITPDEYATMRERYSGKMNMDWIKINGYDTIGFEIDGIWCAACVSDGVIWEILAPPQLEGAAVRRAASERGKAQHMTACSSPVSAECALMTYNGCNRDFMLFAE